MEFLNEYPDFPARVLSGDATSEEKEALQRRIDASPANAKYFEDLRKIWEESGKSIPLDQTLLKQDWNSTRDRITQIQRTETVDQPSRSLYQFVRIAALIVVSAGVIYFLAGRASRKIEITESAQIKTITLTDGSRVTLNANSKLSFPEEFDSKTRSVSLEGEAFFDIKKDSGRTFVIESGNTVTEVLGTSFSVKARADSVVVRVVTGRVSFYNNKETAVILAPGDEGLYMHGKVVKNMITDHNFLSWQTNTLVFSNATMATFARDLARHFNVRIGIGAELSNSCTITAQFKDQTLQEILAELKLLFPVTVEAKGDTIWIEGKGCQSVK